MGKVLQNTKPCLRGFKFSDKLPTFTFLLIITHPPTQRELGGNAQQFAGPGRVAWMPVACHPGDYIQVVFMVPRNGGQSHVKEKHWYPIMGCVLLVPHHGGKERLLDWYPIMGGSYSYKKWYPVDRE